MIYTVIFDVAGEADSIVSCWESENREALILNLCQWMILGSVPIDTKDGTTRFLNSSQITGFDIDGDDGTQSWDLEQRISRKWRNGD